MNGGWGVIGTFIFARKCCKFLHFLVWRVTHERTNTVLYINRCQDYQLVFSKNALSVWRVIFVKNCAVLTFGWGWVGSQFTVGTILIIKWVTHNNVDILFTFSLLSQTTGSEEVRIKKFLYIKRGCACVCLSPSYLKCVIFAQFCSILCIQYPFYPK